MNNEITYLSSINNNSLSANNKFNNINLSHDNEDYILFNTLKSDIKSDNNCNCNYNEDMIKTVVSQICDTNNIIDIKESDNGTIELKDFITNLKNKKITEREEILKNAKNKFNNAKNKLKLLNNNIISKNIKSYNKKVLKKDINNVLNKSKEKNNCNNDNTLKMSEEYKENKIIQGCKKKKNNFNLKEVGLLLKKLNKNYNKRKKNFSKIKKNIEYKEILLKKIKPINLNKNSIDKKIDTNINLENNEKINNIEKIRKMTNERTDHNFRGLDNNLKDLKFNGITVLEENTNNYKTEYLQNKRLENIAKAKERVLEKDNLIKELKVKPIIEENINNNNLSNYDNNSNNFESSIALKTCNSKDIIVDDYESNDKNNNEAVINNENNLKLKHKLKIKDFIIRSNLIITKIFNKSNIIKSKINDIINNLLNNNKNKIKMDTINNIENSMGFGILFDTIRNKVKEKESINTVVISFNNLNNYLKEKDNTILNDYNNNLLILDILRKTWIEDFSKKNFTDIFYKFIENKEDNINDIIIFKDLIADILSFQKTINCLNDDVISVGDIINNINYCEAFDILEKYKKEVKYLYGNFNNLISKIGDNIVNISNNIVNEIESNIANINAKISNTKVNKYENLALDIINNNLNIIDNNINYTNDNKISFNNINDKIKDHNNLNNDIIFEINNAEINIKLNIIENFNLKNNQIKGSKIIQRIWRRILAKREIKKNKLIIKTVTICEKYLKKYKKCIISLIK